MATSNVDALFAKVMRLQPAQMFLVAASLCEKQEYELAERIGDKAVEKLTAQRLGLAERA